MLIHKILGPAGYSQSFNNYARMLNDDLGNFTIGAPLNCFKTPNSFSLWAKIKYTTNNQIIINNDKFDALTLNLSSYLKSISFEFLPIPFLTNTPPTLILKFNTTNSASTINKPGYIKLWPIGAKIEENNLWHIEPWVLEVPNMTILQRTPQNLENKADISKLKSWQNSGFKIGSINIAGTKTIDLTECIDEYIPSLGEWIMQTLKGWQPTFKIDSNTPNIQYTLTKLPNASITISNDSKDIEHMIDNTSQTKGTKINNFDLPTYAMFTWQVVT